MIHNMKVQPKYYNLLKAGIKTIELRLFDEKRQQIKVGDEIIFSNTEDSNDSFKADVIQLHNYESFSDLCDTIGTSKTGFDSKEDLLKVLEEFYPLDKQQKYGVLGIEVKRKV